MDHKVEQRMFHLLGSDEDVYSMFGERCDAGGGRGIRSEGNASIWILTVLGEVRSSWERLG